MRFAELGKAFNTMTARLEDIDRQRSEFVSNASHELKNSPCLHEDTDRIHSVSGRIA